MKKTSTQHLLCTRGCEKIKSQPLHKKSFAFIYLFKFPFKNTIISKCSSLRLALLGLRTSFPNEKRRSTAALDGTGVFNFMNTFFKFLQTERAAKMSLFGGSLKYDSTIFATVVFRRFWLSKSEPKKSSSKNLFSLFHSEFPTKNNSLQSPRLTRPIYPHKQRLFLPASFLLCFVKTR